MTLAMPETAGDGVVGFSAAEASEGEDRLRPDVGRRRERWPAQLAPNQHHLLSHVKAQPEAAGGRSDREKKHQT